MKLSDHPLKPSLQLPTTSSFNPSASLNHPPSSTATTTAGSPAPNPKPAQTGIAQNTQDLFESPSRTSPNAGPSRASQAAQTGISLDAHVTTEGPWPLSPAQQLEFAAAAAAAAADPAAANTTFEAVTGADILGKEPK